MNFSIQLRFKEKKTAWTLHILSCAVFQRHLILKFWRAWNAECRYCWHAWLCLATRACDWDHRWHLSLPSAQSGWATRKSRWTCSDQRQSDCVSLTCCGFKDYCCCRREAEASNMLSVLSHSFGASSCGELCSQEAETGMWIDKRWKWGQSGGVIFLKSS